MAYNKRFPPRLAVERGIDDTEPGLAVWLYSSPTDSTSVVNGAGYISNAKDMGMQAGDIVAIYDETNNDVSLSRVNSFTGKAANLSPISGSGGGSGLSTQKFIFSGTSTTEALLSSFNGWDSLDNGTKTQPIPASTGSLAQIWIMDIAGTADIASGGYAIVAVPASGSIIGNDRVYTQYGLIKLLDTTAGWVNVT